LKDRLPKTIAIGETNFNAKLRKNFAGVLIGGSGKQARENLVGATASNTTRTVECPHPSGGGKVTILVSVLYPAAI